MCAFSSVFEALSYPPFSTPTLPPPPWTFPTTPPPLSAHMVQRCLIVDSGLQILT